MSPAAQIATMIGSGLLLVSRFIQSAKPIWDRLPTSVAVLLPPSVALIPAIAALLGQTKTFADLTTYLSASVVMIVVGLFPSKA